jgi:hypothetical protein
MQRANYARGLRFLPIVAFITTVGVLSARAQNVYTDPVGFITLTAVGTATQNASPAYTYWGIGMTPVPVLRGQIGTVNGTQLPVNTTLTPGQYNAVSQGAQYYIEDMGSNTTHVGFTDDIISNDAANVYTAFNDSGVVLTGDNFKIYPHWNLASLFGATDSAGIQAGNASTADSVQIENANSPGQGLTTYYYNNTSSKSASIGWRSSASATIDQSLVPLYQDAGVLFVRKPSTNLLVQVVGGVKVGSTLIPLGGTNSFTANVYATAATTLGASHLYTDGSSTDSFVAGNSSTADKVVIQNPNTAPATLNTYYYNNVSSKSASIGWRSSASATIDASTTPIPMGAFMLIELQAGRPGFNWTEPAPY